MCIILHNNIILLYVQIKTFIHIIRYFINIGTYYYIIYYTAHNIVPMDKMVNFFITSRGKREIFSCMFQRS